MKKFSYFIIFISSLFAILPWFLPCVAVAIEYKFGGLTDASGPGQYMRALFIWGLGIIGSMAVVGIAYGGFMYMVGKVEQGKDIIYSSLLGLLLLLGSYLILWTINPDLVNFGKPLK